MTEKLHRITRGPERPERVLVVLPGYGDRPEAFLERAALFDPDEAWSVVVLHPRLESPVGPIWYEVDENGADPVALNASIASVSAACAAILATTGLPTERLVLCGFSQGGALALATMLDPGAGEPPGAVAALAAYLPVHEPMDLTRARNRPVLLAHGAGDEAVDPIRGRAASKALHRADALVSWVEVDGGHRFDGPLLAALREWLQSIALGIAPHAPPI